MEVQHLQRLFPAATVEFLAHTLCGCPSHSQVASTKILAESQAPRRSCDFPPFRACLLLAACSLACLLACCLRACLLLAKPVTSTLDTKEGYKTKTGSTSSVTLTLTQLSFVLQPCTCPSLCTTPSPTAFPTTPSYHVRCSSRTPPTRS